MIEILLSIAGLAAYSLYGYLSYTHRHSSWFMVAALACAMAANVVWVLLAKRMHSPDSLFLAGLGWDLVLVSAQASVPILLGLMELRLLTIVGVALVSAGIAVTNWSLR